MPPKDQYRHDYTGTLRMTGFAFRHGARCALRSTLCAVFVAFAAAIIRCILYLRASTMHGRGFLPEIRGKTLLRQKSSLRTVDLRFAYLRVTP